MFKNKFFKKVTSCCLTLAGVLSLSMPCNAKLLKENELNEINRLAEDKKFFLKKKMINDIKFCKIPLEISEVTSLGYNINNVNIFYISSEKLSELCNSLCCYNSEYNFAVKNAEKITEHILNKLGEESSAYSFDLFIIRGNIQNKSLQEFTKDDDTAYFINENEIENKEDLFKKLGFEENGEEEIDLLKSCDDIRPVYGDFGESCKFPLPNYNSFGNISQFDNNSYNEQTEYYNSELGFDNSFQNNFYNSNPNFRHNSNSNLKLGIGVLGMLSLATLGISGAFIATKNASDSKVSKKTNSISKKVMELAKSVIN